MKFQQLGNTGVLVSRIALGTMTFGGGGTPQWDLIGALGQKEADELIGHGLLGTEHPADQVADLLIQTAHGFGGVR
jgi:aryl-alcohol dehydrogenase-like predicted oxidoreductase